MRLAGACLCTLLLFVATVHSQAWKIVGAIDSDTTPKDVGTGPGGVVFADSLTGYAFGMSLAYVPGNLDINRLFNTTDGGNTWSRMKIGKQVPGFSYLSCPDSDAIYLLLTGQSSLKNVLRSYDKGNSWQASLALDQQVRYATMFNRAEGLFDLRDYAVARITNDSAKTLADTRDGEVSYLYLSLSTTVFVADWSDSLHWYYAVNYYHLDDTDMLPVVVTTDGGRHWQNIFPDTLTPRNVHYRQVACVRGTQEAFVLAKDTGISFYYTTDGGQSWSPNRTIPLIIKKIVPVSKSELWAIADSTTLSQYKGPSWILHSTDTGRTWMVDSTTLKGYWAADMYFTDPGHGWILLNNYTGSKTGYDTQLYVAKYFHPVMEVQPIHQEYAKTLESYPDPSKNLVHLIVPFGDIITDVKVSDGVGRGWRVPADFFGDQLTLNLSALPSGVFYLKLTGQSTRVYRSRVSKLP